MWCQTYGYLPSCRESLPFDQYQIILLRDGDRGKCVWTTCSRLSPTSNMTRSPGHKNLANHWIMTHSQCNARPVVTFPTTGHHHQGFDWYQIILLGDRGKHMWTTCSRLLPKSNTARTQNFITFNWKYVLSVLWCCWLGGRKGIRRVKNWVVGCWRGYLSGARCRLAYGPADATATHCLLL